MILRKHFQQEKKKNLEFKSLGSFFKNVFFFFEKGP